METKLLILGFLFVGLFISGCTSITQTSQALGLPGANCTSTADCQQNLICLNNDAEFHLRAERRTKLAVLILTAAVDCDVLITNAFQVACNLHPNLELVRMIVQHTGVGQTLE